MPRDQRKNANGLGSIDQLLSDKWRWRVSFRAAGGKRVRLGGTEKTETAARRALNKAVTDNERGTLAAPDRVTVSEYAKRWLESQPEIRENTRRDYAATLAHALYEPVKEGEDARLEPRLSEFGAMRLRDVRPTDVQAFLKTLSERIMRGGSGRGNPCPRAH